MSKSTFRIKVKGQNWVFLTLFLLTLVASFILVSSLLLPYFSYFTNGSESLNTNSTELNNRPIGIEPVIFDATFFNGEKKIRGKVLPVKSTNEMANVPVDDLIRDFNINLYFSDEAGKKVEDLIGTTGLYKNANGEIEFLFEGKSRPGGYVVAKLTEKPIAENYDVSLTPLSKPVENSTFTVDSTGDTSDASINGVCADSGGKCTFRAAIQEANATAATDNIYFNIPTSDTGYRDFDSPSTTSSGDSLDGDDYWHITAVTMLPWPIYPVNINGSTQPFSTNSYGPEIEITQQHLHSFEFELGSDGSTISSMIMNGGDRTIRTHANNITIQRNYLGVDAKGGITALKGIKTVYTMEGSEDITIGGDDPSEGNIISGDRGVYTHSDNVIIKNNYVINSTEGIWSDGSNIIENNIVIRGPYMTDIVGINATKFTPSIKNNYIENYYYGIISSGNNGHIKGNRLVNNRYGIYNYNYAFTGGRLEDDEYFVTQSIIGGQGSQVGSLCDGLEKNCIENSIRVGIYSADSIPFNENTLFQDNKLSSSYAGSKSIMQQWIGLFEVFSNNNRRTDISDGILQIPSLVTDKDEILNVTNWPGYDFNLNSLVTHYNMKKNCRDGVTDCLDSGKTMLIGPKWSFPDIPGFNFTFDLTSLIALPGWYTFSEYYFDYSGNKHYEGNVDFDEKHISSNTFSFDGNAQTHPVVTGSPRTIEGEAYYDRGEPWTNNPDADRNINTLNYSLFQIMEVEMVDANPIRQSNGTYFIYVDDINTNEDNVSTAGYNDGGGNYSGGGSEGPDGLANNNTSLKEALYVASKHSGTDIIKFGSTVLATEVKEEDLPSGFSISRTGQTIEITDNDASNDTVGGNFKAIYPINIQVNNNLIKFEWSDLSLQTIVKSYDLYIDEKIIKEGLTTTEYTIDFELTPGKHTWYVIAHVEQDGIQTIISTETSEFEVAGINNLPITDSRDRPKLLTWILFAAAFSTAIGAAVFFAVKRKNFLNPIGPTDTNTPNKMKTRVIM